MGSDILENTSEWFQSLNWIELLENSEVSIQDGCEYSKNITKDLNELQLRIQKDIWNKIQKVWKYFEEFHKLQKGWRDI